MAKREQYQWKYLIYHLKDFSIMSGFSQDKMILKTNWITTHRLPCTKPNQYHNPPDDFSACAVMESHKDVYPHHPIQPIDANQYPNHLIFFYHSHLIHQLMVYFHHLFHFVYCIWVNSYSDVVNNYQL